VFSVKPLFKRFQRFEKSLYDLKELVLYCEKRNGGGMPAGPPPYQI